MTFTPEQNKWLEAPLSSSHVKERTQGGKTLSYIEAWQAIAEANRIFGFDAWTRETVLLQETNRDLVDLRGQNGPYQQWRVGYLAKVRITVGEAVREGTGFGSGMAKPEALGEAIESAAKEAESDAMKRALMTFGNPFGLALYDKTQANVVKDDEAVQGRSNGHGEAIQGGVSPSSEGPDFWHCTEPGMSAFAAKKAGLDTIHETLRHEMAEMGTAEGMKELIEANIGDIRKMPRSWRVELRATADEAAVRLRGSGTRVAA